MSKDFVTLHPIDTVNAKMDGQPSYSLPDYTPSYHRIQPYTTFGVPFIAPMEFTNWRDEAMAAQKTCAVYTGLNPSPIFRITGPDAAAFLKHVTVNYIDRFPIMSSKHGITVNEDGDITSNGVLMRIAEDSYEAHWMMPLATLFAEGEWNATFENHSMDRFIFQLIGPKSLEIVEDAAEDDFHDLKLCQMKVSSICGHEVRILRFGMTGGLAYEIHGDTQFAKEIHRRVIEVGNKYGVRLLGQRAYMLSHTPGGSVQFGFHFDQALPKEAVESQMDKTASSVSSVNYDLPALLKDGSVGDNYEVRKANPFEMGLGKVIDFGHDFIGRDALLAYREHQTHTGVTLKWNEEDILDVYASQLRDEEPYKRFDYPSQNMNLVDHAMTLTMDYVEDAEGNVIGATGGRTESPFHRAMVSFGKIKLEFAELGTEVFVVWGDVGERQKRIRATVVPTPYNTNYSNRTFDVMSIPRKYAK